MRMFGSRTARTQRAALSRFVLGLDGEFQRVVLADVVALPEPLEEVEAELTSQRFLDHFAVACCLSVRRCTLTARSTSSLDGQCCAYLRHLTHHSIMMRRCHLRGKPEKPAGAALESARGPRATR